jgi:hypothetical protein
MTKEEEAQWALIDPYTRTCGVCDLHSQGEGQAALPTARSIHLFAVRTGQRR